MGVLDATACVSWEGRGCSGCGTPLELDHVLGARRGLDSIVLLPTRTADTVPSHIVSCDFRGLPGPFLQLLCRYEGIRVTGLPEQDLVHRVVLRFLLGTAPAGLEAILVRGNPTH